MKARCKYEFLNCYKNYGGRGITVCEEWIDDFTKFKEDMYEDYIIHCKNYSERETTIERIDVNLGYNKENCTWATYKEQANNTTQNIVYEINGEEKTQKQWCEYFEMNYSTVVSRINKGWTIKEALELDEKEGFVKRKDRNFNIGTIHSTINYGDYKILSLNRREYYGIHSVKYFEIEFINTNSKKIVSETCMDSGRIKDNYVCLDFGKGYIGDGYESTHHLYSRWHCMMSKCYNKKDKEYKSNGEIGTIVEDNWHNFQNYVRDVIDMSSYDEGRILQGIDIIAKDYKSKIYSKETCFCINRNEHNKIKAINQFPNHIIIDTIYGIFYYIENMKQFCRENEWVRWGSIKRPKKTKSLYKDRWYILYEEDYNNNKEFYDSFIKVS